MALKTYKLGELISVVDERNLERIKKFYGININKEFMPTVANTNELDESKYKVVRKNRFVFSGMQTGRDECIRISMYLNENPIIVSPAYVTFEISRTDIVLPMFFFMLFLSKEKDRLGWFYSDGSIRSNLDWPVFCDISITLPDITIQQKYVDIYESMVANQKAYEKGLDDLKLTCDAFLDKLKKECPKKEIGKLLTEVDRRNLDGQITSVKGINIDKKFIDSVADTNGVDLKKYKLVLKNELAYSGMQTGRDRCVRIALQDTNKSIIISPAYSVFQVEESKILPEYVMMWFSRTEIDRLGWFYSDASIRANLDNDRLFEMQIPIPNISVQRSIADIYKVYTERKRINEQLKQQIKDICPILIKGSLEE
ncbi:restriction endonuclease subunit S [Hallerella succinigenes]|uniref:Type I restriction enzyme S subunit n=1 Tax=Hallerella succinigenes TaxID=1896222 RepID=A0A2M9A9A6_9BACT|nr:restriction endonuclease subunit S [Hallerella succinigenes]PJJ42203.1 type I restriction enzyme S subunit [Hallerella succinigenes]